MNRFIAIIMAFIVSGSALAITDTDQQLLEYGIVDDNFVYQDIDAAGIFFQSIAKQVAVSLPQRVSSDLEWNSNVITPYSSFSTYRYLFDINNEEAKEMMELASEPSFINEMCKTYYLDEFLKANNYQITYTYLDVDYKHVYNFKMSKDVCRRALATTIISETLK